jgi:hypothetical protein
MLRRAVLLAAAATALTAGPAAANPPTRTEVVQDRTIVEATECGVLSWDIHLVADVTTFVNREGIKVREVAHVKEDNTITNLITGETFREGPDSFTQTTYFNPDESVDRIVATGLAANVQGEQFKDVGRVVLVPIGTTGRVDLVFAAGPHPLREAADEGRPVRDAIEGFCSLFE